MKGSGLFNFGKSDIAKSLIIFVLSTIISVVGDAILQELNNGSYSFSNIHWNEISMTVLVAVLTYLKKNFLTNSKDEFLKKD